MPGGGASPPRWGGFSQNISFPVPPPFIGGFIGVGAKKTPAEPDFTLKLRDTHKYYYITTYNTVNTRLSPRGLI